MTEVPVGLLGNLPSADLRSAHAVEQRSRNVLRPAGALARLDQVAAWLAGWQRTDRPAVRSPALIVFVADHGVVDEGVSAYPATVTRAMLEALEAGVATASVMGRALGAELRVVDVGTGRPTMNLSRHPALSEERFVESFEAGRGAVRDVETDLLVLGEMGIGNTTAAAAVCAVIFGGPADRWTGLGTGIDPVTLDRKIEVVEMARRRVGPLSSPFEALRQVGGAELVAIAGAAMEARIRSIPVVLDGFVVTAAVAPLEMARPGALDHTIAGHCSSEPGHRLLLDKLGKCPLLDLDLRLGEGSGALLAVPLIGLAADCVTKVATFSEWGLG